MSDEEVNITHIIDSSIQEQNEDIIITAIARPIEADEVVIAENVAEVVAVPIIEEEPPRYRDNIYQCQNTNRIVSWQELQRLQNSTYTYTNPNDRINWQNLYTNPNINRIEMNPNINRIEIDWRYLDIHHRSNL